MEKLMMGGLLLSATIRMVAVLATKRAANTTNYNGLNYVLMVAACAMDMPMRGFF